MILAVAAQPAAQPQYSPAKLVSRASGSIEPKGKGTVTVQVELSTTGSVKAVRVLRSSNSGDNAAAMDIAQHSTFAPERRNGKAVRSLFDFTIAFGQNVVSGAAGKIDALLHQSKWDEAKTEAQAALAQDPSDAIVQAQLGVADAFTHDIAGAAAAFDKAGTVPQQYSDIAQQAYALNTPVIAPKDPKAALAEAQKAMSYGRNALALYALGVAQEANHDSTTALASLQQAQQMAATSSPSDTQSEIDIAQEMMVIYLAQGNTSAADQMAAKIDDLDSTHQMSRKVVAYYYDQRGIAMQGSRDQGGAISMFEKAASADKSAAPMEYTKAAIMYMSGAIPDYLKAKSDADKAIAADSKYPLAYYVAGIALAKNALATQNDAQSQDADVYLQTAIDLANQEGNKQLAGDAAYFKKNRNLASNLAQWATQPVVNPSVNPMYAPGR